jgi:hypothetical protein
MEKRKRKGLPSREFHLNREQRLELASLAKSLRRNSSGGLEQLHKIFRKTRRTTLPGQVTKAKKQRSYLLNLISSVFLAYVNLLSGKLDGLNTKADEVLKFVKP